MGTVDLEKRIEALEAAVARYPMDLLIQRVATLERQLEKTVELISRLTNHVGRANADNSEAHAAILDILKEIIDE